MEDPPTEDAAWPRSLIKFNPAVKRALKVDAARRGKAMFRRLDEILREHLQLEAKGYPRGAHPPDQTRYPARRRSQAGC